MRFSQLLGGAPFTGADVEITGLARDSRNVKPGQLFAALPGHTGDGISYIEQAIQSGAVAIVAPLNTNVSGNVSVALAAEPRQLFARISARFYPHQPEHIAAVTGTSGKTSTVQFTRQFWQLAGKRAASIGTLGIIGNDIERYGSLTTPDCVSLHQDLDMLATEKKITHVAMEASSHGLDQYRLDGVNLKYAAFTNFSREHLDYHQTMEAYLNAKLRLFGEVLPATGTAVINRDIPEFDHIAAVAIRRGIKVISFGEGQADIRITKKEYAAGGQNITLSAFGKTYTSQINLVGAFQSANILCAASIAIASGEDVQATINNMPRLVGVRGRLERVGSHKDGTVYVDYAHKPDALENVLKALRPHTTNRLIVVFGCGGNRDTGKRPIMGEIAQRLADVVIVTDDNPRFEDPASIRKAVLEGCPGATEIGDRTKAIAAGLEMMKNGDVLVIAGKGHETGQIIQGQTVPFDDVEVARSKMQGLAA